VLAVVLAGLAAAAAALGAGAASTPLGTASGATVVASAPPLELLPGVTYERQAALTSHGPVVLNVVVGPRPGGLLTLEPALSNDIVPGSEPLTSIERRLSATATTLGVAGDFGTTDGRPLGLVLRGGALLHQPLPTRASVGVDATGTLRAARVQLLGTWQGSGPRRLLSLVNGAPTGNQLALYTPAWGPTTPPANGTVEVVLQPFPPTTSPGELTGTVSVVAFGGGSVIPPDGVVLVARGSSATNLAAEAKVGQLVKLRLILKPDWTGVVDGIGGGPLLVSNGVAVFRPVEGFLGADLLARSARSAVGQRADGSIVLVTVDGGRSGTSVGMTSFELAQAMVRLGAVVAVGQVTGPQAAMAFNGTLLSRPAPAEVPIADALLFVYRGVYVPPVAPVLSPDGDGSADTVALSYKTVRPSQVTATLLGPDGGPRLADQGERAPQSYTFAWNGLTPAGAPDVEGLYRWTVAATDDLGRQSSMERTFTLNRTLRAVRAVALLHTSAGTAQPAATYELTRAARVAVTVLSPQGVTVAQLPVQSLQPGKQTVAWDGRDVNAGTVAPGRYTLSVTAVNDLGSVSQTAALAVRR
jgi:hypothetical protein